jgi:hypothetical protein
MFSALLMMETIHAQTNSRPNKTPQKKKKSNAFVTPDGKYDDDDEHDNMVVVNGVNNIGGYGDNASPSKESEYCNIDPDILSLDLALVPIWESRTARNLFGFGVNDNVEDEIQRLSHELMYAGNDFQTLLKFIPSLDGGNEDDVRKRIGGDNCEEYLKKKCQYLGKAYTTAGLQLRRRIALESHGKQYAVWLLMKLIHCTFSQKELNGIL